MGKDCLSRERVPPSVQRGSTRVDFNIRKARISDVREILALVNKAAAENLLLPRGPQYVYENIRDFVVVEAIFQDTETLGAAEGPRSRASRSIVACGSLHVLWEDLAEVRSLAICPEFQSCELGKRIIELMKEEAMALGVRRLFAFTLVEGFFRALGFEPKEREQLPAKVWGECSRCPKYFNCNEVGMILEL